LYSPFGLAAHGPAHHVGQVDVLDRDQGHLHPGIGDLIDGLLQPLVELIPFPTPGTSVNRAARPDN
jgi:hypothetical protein